MRSDHFAEVYVFMLASIIDIRDVRRVFGSLKQYARTDLLILRRTTLARVTRVARGQPEARPRVTVVSFVDKNQRIPTIRISPILPADA